MHHRVFVLSLAFLLLVSSNAQVAHATPTPMITPIAQNTATHLQPAPKMLLIYETTRVSDFLEITAADITDFSATPTIAVSQTLSDLLRLDQSSKPGDSVILCKFEFFEKCLIQPKDRSEMIANHSYFIAFLGAGTTEFITLTVGQSDYIMKSDQKHATVPMTSTESILPINNPMPTKVIIAPNLQGSSTYVLQICLLSLDGSLISMAPAPATQLSFVTGTTEQDDSTNQIESTTFFNGRILYGLLRTTDVEDHQYFISISLTSPDQAIQNETFVIGVKLICSSCSVALRTLLTKPVFVFIEETTSNSSDDSATVLELYHPLLANIQHYKDSELDSLGSIELQLMLDDSIDSAGKIRANVFFDAKEVGQIQPAAVATSTQNIEIPFRRLKEAAMHATNALFVQIEAEHEVTVLLRTWLKPDGRGQENAGVTSKDLVMDVLIVVLAILVIGTLASVGYVQYQQYQKGRLLDDVDDQGDEPSQSENNQADDEENGKGRMEEKTLQKPPSTKSGAVKYKGNHIELAQEEEKNVRVSGGRKQKRKAKAAAAAAAGTAYYQDKLNLSGMSETEQKVVKPAPRMKKTRKDHLRIEIDDQLYDYAREKEKQRQKQLLLEKMQAAQQANAATRVAGAGTDGQSAATVAQVKSNKNQQTAMAVAAAVAERIVAQEDEEEEGIAVESCQESNQKLSIGGEEKQSLPQQDQE